MSFLQSSVVTVTVPHGGSQMSLSLSYTHLVTTLHTSVHSYTEYSTSCSSATTGPWVQQPRAAIGHGSIAVLVYGNAVSAAYVVRTFNNSTFVSSVDPHTFHTTYGPSHGFVPLAWHV